MLRYFFEQSPQFAQALFTKINMAKSLRFADGVEVPVPGFGAMGISFALGNNLSYDEAEPVLLKALELGCTFWDGR